MRERKTDGERDRDRERQRQRERETETERQRGGNVHTNEKCLYFSSFDL